MKKALFVAGLAGFAAVATAQVTITEVYVGINGEDGTQDWIEVTNTSASVFDTGTLLFDDVNPSVANAGTLTSFLLNPGESAVFLIGAAAVDNTTYSNSIDEFLAIWGFNPGDINLGLTNGGGALGQSDDAANIGFDNGGVFQVIDALSYPVALTSSLASIEDTADGLRISVLGENGAFESNAFFNDNNGLPNDLATLVASPGVIPAPASAALLGLGGLVAIRRRR